MMNRPLAAILALAAIAIVALLIYGPVAQPAEYHTFADSGMFLGVPHGRDVLSNLLFLVAGWSGLRWVRSARRSVALPLAWSWVFLGSILVFLGSSWYHLAPSDERLVWDRLAMAIAFAAYLAALLAEYVDARLDRVLLYTLMPAAVASVLYWYASGDLRPWIIAQGMPILATPIVLLLARRPGRGSSWLWLASAAYLLAKAAEVADASVYSATAEMVSGHTLKHLLAGLGVLMFGLRLKALQRNA